MAKRLKITRKALLDLAERAAWTGLQAGLGIIAANELDIPQGYAALAAVALSTLKSYVATKVGNPNSASTLNIEP